MTVTYLPVGEIAATYGSPVQADVPFAYPGHDPPERVMVKVPERAFRDAVAEVKAQPTSITQTARPKADVQRSFGPGTLALAGLRGSGH